MSFHEQSFTKEPRVATSSLISDTVHCHPIFHLSISTSLYSPPPSMYHATGSDSSIMSREVSFTTSARHCPIGLGPAPKGTLQLERHFFDDDEGGSIAFG